MPIAAGLSVQTGIDPAFMAAIIVGGSFFGDNLSFISDTTIAATRSQGCSMIDKFKANLGIAAPAALVVAVIYVIQGLSVDFTPMAQKVEWVKLIPYLLVLVMAISGVNVMGVLTAGIILNAIIGFACGNFEWTSFLGSVGSGIGSMGELIIVTMLAGGMLEMIRVNGGIDFIIKVMTKRISGKRGAELTIGGLVSLANLCTANNTIAIITTGNIAKDIASRFGVDPRKSASILDTFSCLVQGIIPYGAQMLMATSLLNATLSSTAGAEQVSSMAIIAKLYYPYALGVFAILAILLRFPKKYS
jgi:Na+/H+ antiporter NhaC